MTGHSLPATRMLGRAFHQDPLFAHVQPNAGRRERLLLRLFAGAIRHCGRHGGVVMLDDAAAAALWVPVSRMRLRVRDVITARMLTLPARVGVAAMWRLQRHEGPKEDRIVELAEPDDTYLWILGVDPDRHGRGLGRRTVTEVLAETAGRACWLKTEQPHNVAIYERLGFRLVETIDLGALPSFVMRHPGNDASWDADVATSAG